MKLEFFQRKFWTASRQCASLDGKCSISCDDETVNCYLIDNNGFILVSEDYTQTPDACSLSGGYYGTLSRINEPMKQGQSLRQLESSPTYDWRFFGEAEGAVMNKLLSMGSFKRITLYDYQAMCRANKESSDSAHGLLDPYNAFLSAAKWIMTELVLFLVEFNLCSWWHSGMTAEAQKLKQTLEPCDTEYPAFVSERTIKETTGNIACEDCSKSFVIQQIPSSNLFMVVVDSSCLCESVAPITMAPIEIRSALATLLFSCPLLSRLWQAHLHSDKYSTVLSEVLAPGSGFHTVCVFTERSVLLRLHNVAHQHCSHEPQKREDTLCNFPDNPLCPEP
ncbi:hypothetical protein STEG23_019615 [Scotinomys teguina]